MRYGSDRLELLVSKTALDLSKGSAKSKLGDYKAPILSVSQYFVYRPEPRVLKMFDILRDAQRGKPVNFNGVRYPSRSEAEAALVTGLVQASWSFDQIMDKFEEEQPGHYAEVRNRSRYLAQTYNNQVRYIMADKGIEMVEAAPPV